jgi:ribose transport system ATP-binding protein
MSSGELDLAARSIVGLSTRQRIRRGMAMLTESRHEDGLCLQASIVDNMGLVAAPNYASKLSGLLRSGALRHAIRAMRESVKLTPTAHDKQPVRTLSGGNQQKIVLGKWLLNHPRVLILDEPTRGIDVGAKYEIHALIDRLAADGASVLVISSEIEELIGICDRILVMSEGELRDELARGEFDRERIMRAALRSDSTTGATA